MRLLPERHDHQHQGAADCGLPSFGSRGAGSAPASSVPLRRACRDHARGDAGCRSYCRGARLMTAPASPDGSRTSAGNVVGRFVTRRPLKPSNSRPSSGSPPTARSPPSTAMSISEPASAPRSGRSSPRNSTCPLLGSSSCSAIPPGAQPGRDHRQRDHPDHRSAACAMPPRRPGIFWWRAPPSGSACRWKRFPSKTA